MTEISWPQSARTFKNLPWLNDDLKQTWLSELAAALIDDFPTGESSNPEIPGSNPDTLQQSNVVDWIEEHFYIPETRGPLLLAEYQRTVLQRVFTTDHDGLLPYSTIIWSDIKKSAKSTIAAAVVLWYAFQIDMVGGWGSIVIIANDLKQAESRVAYYLRRAILLNPTLRDRVRIRTSDSSITLPNHTVIEAVPIDPTGEAGANADAVVFSELWGAHSKAQQTMWTEATLPPNKFGRSFRWVETYAGYQGSSPLLEQLFDVSVVHGRRLDPDLEIYDNSVARMFCLWNTQPRLAWQTEDYYRQERANLLPSEFNRVHRNQWSLGSEEPFLPDIALWDACRVELPPLGRHIPCVLALDAGESNDTFGEVIVSASPASSQITAVRHARAYVPRGGAILNHDEIEINVRELGQNYAIQALVYDPFMLGQFVRRLGQPATLYRASDTERQCPLSFPRFPAALIPFPQGQARLIADKGLLDLILTRRIQHDGNLQLREHIQNADRRLDPISRRIRIVKRSYTLKIDLAVTLSMAAAHFLSLPAKKLGAFAQGRARGWT